MKNKIFLLVLWVFLLTPAFCQQQRNITSYLISIDKIPIPQASVSLLKDSIIIKTSMTDQEGKFSFENVQYGSYVLSITAVGFTALIDTIVISLTHPGIATQYEMKQKSNILKNISVISSKPFIEQKIDRTVLNIDALVSNAGISALEVLENAPGVIVSSEGAISLKGKTGVVIFIDEKPTYLSEADLANYLKSLPSGSLDKIEIMPNPPARYDAAGNGGVINIRTKKSRKQGLNGGVNISFGQGRYSRTNNSFHFNYKNKNINFFGTTSYSLNNSFSDLDIFRYYYNTDGSLQSTFFQNSYIRRKYYSTNLKLGLDFFLSPKTTLGILVNGIIRPLYSKTINKSTVANAGGITDSIVTADNRENNKWKNGSINLNFLHKYNPDKELSFDLDYIIYNSLQDQHFLNGIFSPAGNLKSTDGLNGSLPSELIIYSAKVDYSNSITKNTKLSSGVKTSYVTTDNAANYFTIVANVTKPDYDKTNHFRYKETINAGYLNLNKDWKRFSLQAGLRVENTVSRGHQLGNFARTDSAFTRTYTNLFPTVYMLYKADTLSKNQFSFSFGRRIDRPYYQDLNPFISPLDKFSIYVGNPYLQPTFTNSFELSHIFQNKITTTLSYSTTKDIVEETIDLANSIYISRPANIGKSTILGVSVTGNLKLTKLWSATFFAEIQNRYYKGAVYNYPLDTTSVYAGANMSNQFTLGKGWTAEINANYRTGLLVGQIISSATGRLNAGIAKKILNNKGSIKLNVRDIFYTGLNHGIITSIKGAYATYHNLGDTRNFTISFNYNFGKSTNQQRSRTPGAETEQNRVKN